MSVKFDFYSFLRKSRREHRVDHILRLRDLQDITGGFNAFIPLVFQTENNYLKVKEPVTANEILKLILKTK